MTKRYVFIGSYAEMGGLRLDHFGQVVELSEEMASSVIKIALLPEDEFKRIDKPNAPMHERLATALRKALDLKTGPVGTRLPEGGD